MTAVQPVQPARQPVQVTATDPSVGCSVCGRRETVQLHPFHGRRCVAHAVVPTLPTGPYRRGLAEHLVDIGRPSAAFQYLGAWLSRWVDDRFGVLR